MHMYIIFFYPSIDGHIAMHFKLIFAVKIFMLLDCLPFLVIVKEL